MVIRTIRRVRVALFIATVCAGNLAAQARGSLADSVSHLVAAFARGSGNFATSFAIGSYDGDKAPMRALSALFDATTGQDQRDSLLNALVDGFRDTVSTKVRFKGRPITRGAINYFVLRNLIYRETDDDWPGNFYDHPTAERLRKAGPAWREAIAKRWYSAA